MIEEFDLKELTGSDEITCYADIRFGRLWLAAYADIGISGVMPHPVLCRMPCDLPRFSGVDHRLHAA